MCTTLAELSFIANPFYEESNNVAHDYEWHYAFIKLKQNEIRYYKLQYNKITSVSVALIFLYLVQHKNIRATVFVFKS